MFALLFFVLLLVAMYFVLDMVAKNSEKVRPGNMRRKGDFWKKIQLNNEILSKLILTYIILSIIIKFNKG